MDYSIYTQQYNYMQGVLNRLAGVQTSSDQVGNVFSDMFARLYTDKIIRTRPNYAATGTENTSMEAIFREASEIYGVPLSLLKAVAKAESGFDANAVSPAGAQGVMQLMPATAAALGVENPFDARSNIMGGAMYLAEKLNQYGGNIDLTLASYNAGSGNVEKYGGVPPFSETINYVAKVKEYMNQNIREEAVAGNTGSTYLGNALTSTKTEAFSADVAEYFVQLMQLQMMVRGNSMSMLWNGADPMASLL